MNVEMEPCWKTNGWSDVLIWGWEERGYGLEFLLVDDGLPSSEAYMKVEIFCLSRLVWSTRYLNLGLTQRSIYNRLLYTFTVNFSLDRFTSKSTFHSLYSYLQMYYCIHTVNWTGPSDSVMTGVSWVKEPADFKLDSRWIELQPQPQIDHELPSSKGFLLYLRACPVCTVTLPLTVFIHAFHQVRFTPHSPLMS